MYKQAPVYSTVNYIQYLMINHNKNNIERKNAYLYVCVTEAL